MRPTVCECRGCGTDRGGGGGGYESARQRSRDRVSQSFLSLMGMLTLSGFKFTRIFRAVSFFLLFKSKLQVNSRKENLFSVESFDNKKSRGASGFGNLNSWNYSSKI